MKNRKKIRRTAAIAGMMSLGILAVSASGKESEKILAAKSENEAETEAGNDMERESAEQQEEPFRIRARCRTCFDDEEETMAERLEVRYLIENMTQKDYQDVSYVCSLNEEARDYIADGIIELSQEPMDVSYLEKMEKAEEKSDEMPVVCGFSMCWGMALTPEEELQEIYHRSPEGLKDAIKSLEVEITWKGGEQKVSVPLTLEEDVDWPEEDWYGILDKKFEDK